MNRRDWLIQFGAAVKATRMECGWSQSELADRLRLTRSSVANLEAGRQDVPSSTAARLVALLRIDLPGWVLVPDDHSDELVMARAEIQRLLGLIRDAHRALESA